MASFLVADSGSTKTEWILSFNNGEIKKIITSGMNPLFNSENEIFTILNRNFTLYSFGYNNYCEDKQCAR